MRPIGLGLVAALVAAILAPMAVNSATKQEAPKISAEQRKQGMAEAPAAVKAANLPCQVSDARFIGKSAEDKKKGTPATSYYEVACGAGKMGFLIAAPAGGDPATFTCAEQNYTADGKPSQIPCILPDNADPKIAVGAALKEAGVDCAAPESIRGIGQTKTSIFIEAACPGNVGYIMIAPTPYGSKPAQTQNCLGLDDGGGNIKCTLIDKEKRLAVLDKFVADAKNNCAIKERRYIGQSQDGSSFFETSCQDGKGYIYKIGTNNALAQTYECAKAQNVLGGCTLTDARQAASEQAALYTRLAKAAGSTCDVDHYAAFPARGDADVVELVCKDGSGGVGVFRAGGKGSVLDCGHALVSGYRCGINKADAGFAELTADLKKFDKNTCQVSAARLAAQNDKGNIYVEVACADHLKGYMIEFKPDPVTPVSATGCAITGGCKLPGNT